MQKLVKNILFIGIILAFSNKSASFNVECVFEIKIWNFDNDQLYVCIAQNNLNITSPENPTITSVTGIHKQGETNNIVEGFSCESCKFEYFPKGLEIIFPNLKAISFYSNKIKEVHQSDLKPFLNLEYLYLGNNLIYVIEEDLFKFNPNLKLISFENNQIFYIHPKVFDNLNNLKYLDLAPLLCMTGHAFNNSTAVGEVIRVVKAKCDDKRYSAFDKEIKNLELNHNSLNSTEYNHQLSKLEKNLRKTKYFSIFQKRIEKLHEIMEAKEYEAKLPQTVKALEIKLEEVMEILSNIKKQMELKQDKKSGLLSMPYDFWKLVIESICEFPQIIILVVIYIKLFWE